MKATYKFNISLIFLAFSAIMSSCEKDNRPEPKSFLKGRIVYEGQTLGVRSNGVQLEIWQRGYQLFTKIPVFINQDGTFSASLFDGNYKLVRLRGNGPWVNNTDTIDVELRGTKELDVPVRPYFVFKNDTYSKGEGKVSATFTLQKVEATGVLERVNLYVGTTNILDPNNNGGNVQQLGTTITDLTKPITLTATLSAALAGRDYVYARIGVKTSGVGEMLFGAPQKIQLK
ncbi:DUF3823 domain-containing protein [Dyadobacter psychrotolerans]|uniref:DUF3823 domain-containing protein n=1 Tax=Dyadobacter psychrotolerans TaxID=2541721 RepID=A0A4R5DCX0_9BACT|nr:DUF3823 domain-containing protein [Dyadobacter psychrotolerans]TDE11632.1 DUF3823 domain-containing protein [Dyadobacter psychrotolerans]